MQQFDTNTKIGILGGGQLGKMLIHAGLPWHQPIYVLEKELHFPAVPYATRYVRGDFKNYSDVYSFGKQVDVLTIEIEHVNTAALHQLKKEGLTVHPDPEKLAIIKDKGLQKQFYQAHHLPTPPFQLFENKASIEEAIKSKTLGYPFVQKTRTAGYDGKGVKVIHHEKDVLFDTASVVEPLVNIDKEIAVIVARNEQGEIAAFPAVEMAFNPVANLVEMLVCPARISSEIAAQAEALAKSVIAQFSICGLLAVELFLTTQGDLLINEVAPRPHNSGHQTIESAYTSQYEQHLRAILDFPLGSTKLKTPSVMVNLLGAEGHYGTAHYKGLKECLAMDGVHLHLYGKTFTQPFRKMGHATVTADDIATAIEKANIVKETLKVVSK